MQGMTELEWQQKIQKNCRQVRDVRGGCGGSGRDYERGFRLGLYGGFRHCAGNL